MGSEALAGVTTYVSVLRDAPASSRSVVCPPRRGVVRPHSGRPRRPVIRSQALT
jgi:hypothetical protein